jgi:hypothetical protein
MPLRYPNSIGYDRKCRVFPDGSNNQVHPKPEGLTHPLPVVITTVAEARRAENPEGVTRRGP